MAFDMKTKKPHNLERRQFLRQSAILGGATALLSGLSLPFAHAKSSEFKNQQNPTLSSNDSEEKITYSACMVNCGSRCPVKVHTKNGVITRISSENGINEAVLGEQQIRPCLRGRSIRWRTYSPDRIKYPMKRIGKRGEGKFERISWDEATSIIADKLAQTIAKYGNESVFYSYGSGLTGTNLSGPSACQRLLKCLGGYLKYHGTYSDAQIMRIQSYFYGSTNNVYGTEFQTLFDQVKNSDLVVMFGQNIAETRMSGGGQINELYHALAKSHAKVIIIDPRQSDSVIAFNAEWIPIKPGTDSALIAGMLHTLIEENLINDDLVNQYAVGWDSSTLPENAPENSDYKSYLLGLSYDKTPKTAEWASQLTGISAERIKQLAKEIATAKNAWISQGWGPQRTQTGEHVARTIMALPIITGHFGRQGTNLGTWGGSVPFPLAGFPAMENKVQASIPVFLWTEAIENPQNITKDKAFLTGADKLEHGIKFLWAYASNVIGNQHADLNRTAQILEDESKCEFILVWDTHFTSSARFADLVLPDVSPVETSDLINNSYQSGAYNYLIRTQQAIQPLFENRISYDVLAEIAEKLGVKQEFTQGKTYQEWIEYAYAKTREMVPTLPPFAQTDNKGVIARRYANSDDYIALKAFRDDPISHPLNTPSGKVEIYSERLAQLPHEWIFPEGDKLYPIPAYLPSLEGVQSTELLKKYPFQLTGYHTKGHVHSSYANVPELKQVAPDRLWINPLDAKKRKIKPGDLVEVYNDRGALYMPAKITNRIMPGVLAMPQGAWAKVNQQGVDIGGCVNRITSLRPTVLAKGNPQHTNLVEIRSLFKPLS